MKSPSHPISDETLFGFLLSALPDEEQVEIASRLQFDAELKQRVDDLKSLLSPLETETESFEPRGDLVSRTMQSIQNSESTENQESSSDNHRPVGMTAVMESAGRENRWAWLDSLVMLAAGITILCLLLPSVWISREESRRFACASHLRELGTALNQFTQSNNRRELPKIELQGPLSFAGVYVLKLNDARLLDSTNWIWCPSNGATKLKLAIPEVDEYLASSDGVQQTLQRTIGGSYSYNLGNIVEGAYRTRSVTGSTWIPIAGDTLIAPDLQESSNVALHAINTANVLFEDGRVQCLSWNQSGLSPSLDHPYLNRWKHRAVGLGADDACLGPSQQNPIKPAMLVP